MMKKFRFAMMKKIFLLSAIGATLGLFNSCSTDFDVAAPYKEIIVINGLLNPLDSVHYIHVGKAFLGEGDVFKMAQQADSINYADILDVKLEKVRNNNVDSTFILQRTTEIAKDSGAFAYPYQVMYKTTQKLLSDATYRIVVTNRETGVTARSTAKMLKDVNVKSPNILLNNIIDLASTQGPYQVIYDHVRGNSFMHDFMIRFHYREISPANVSTDKSFDWNFSEQVPGETEVKFLFQKNDFFKVIGENIPVRSGYKIRLDSLSNGRYPIEFIIAEASEDLVTHYKLQNTTGGIVLDKPSFTTVENGLGIFTGRLLHSEFLFPNAVTQAAFDTSQYTSQLNFEF
jgi:hypothetical protein